MSCLKLSVETMSVYVLSFWILELVSGCGHHQTEENGLCCDKCPPGTHLENFCSKSQQTTCKPCPEGYFSDHYSSFDRCQKCRSCPQGYAEKCTATTNANCTCGPGFLCSNINCSGCVENTCVTGYKLKARVVSSYRGLGEYSYECEPLCPEDTFFNAGSCKPRTQCRALGLAEQFPGNETHDSVCEKPETKRGDRHSNHLLLGLGCILLSAAILLLLSQQAVKKLRKHRANKITMLAVAANTDDFHLSKEESGLVFINRNESEDSKSFTCNI